LGTGTALGIPFVGPGRFGANVPNDVWAMTIGGYPVLETWLSYRVEGWRPRVALLLHEWAGTSKGVNESVEVRLSKAFDVALQVRHHRRNSPGCRLDWRS